MRPCQTRRRRPTVGTNADPKHFDPAAFGPDLVDINPWFPLTPGYQSVREGGVNKGSRRLPHRRVYTVTDVTKVINGVKTVLVLDQDFDGGELAEQALDYLAEDNQGNVWYLGSYTEAYEGGQFVNANDAWLAGVNGGKAGILMMTNPQTDTPTYAQADRARRGHGQGEGGRRRARRCASRSTATRTCSSSRRAGPRTRTSLPESVASSCSRSPATPRRPRS